MLATSTDLSDYEVYQIATKLSEQMHNLIKGIPFNATKVTDTDPQRDLYYPLHEGALSFYSHDPPFFLNPQMLAGIGTYLSVLFAGSTILSQSCATTASSGSIMRWRERTGQQECSFKVTVQMRPGIKAICGPSEPRPWRC